MSTVGHIGMMQIPYSFLSGSGNLAGHQARATRDLHRLHDLGTGNLAPLSDSPERSVGQMAWSGMHTLSM